jgi:hypothetical protein
MPMPSYESSKKPILLAVFGSIWQSNPMLIWPDVEQNVEHSLAIPSPKPAPDSDLRLQLG